MGITGPGPGAGINFSLISIRVLEKKVVDRRQQNGIRVSRSL